MLIKLNKSIFSLMVEHQFVVLYDIGSNPIIYQYYIIKFVIIVINIYYNYIIIYFYLYIYNICFIFIYIYYIDIGKLVIPHYS